MARDGVASFDLGGFGRAFSQDITPMRHAVRASSPRVMPHAVRSRECTSCDHGRLAATSFAAWNRSVRTITTCDRSD
ncbi:hypothetical protein FYL48_11785 [Shigella flexneri]|nr:hypothetical protein [Shigella flexneri]EFW2238610.1 hypothetical protein [Shigella flexneri]EFW2536689.1 hypothetical protein [Shigella flexneri]EFX2194269.1 hypothetical protein [Shigella flexneri]EGD8870531.1 hypothetical protein [Shigella flexneri]